MNFYIDDIIPERDVIFVLGSNTEERHGSDSTKVARERFGAVYGVGD